MEQDVKKTLEQDPDGLLTYEYIANNIGRCDDIMPQLVDNMLAVDTTGQFTSSAARYLHAIDPSKYSAEIARLIEGAIAKDRGHNFIPGLLPAIWGADYEERAKELYLSDNNFRRIYKRVNPPADTL